MSKCVNLAAAAAVVGSVFLGATTAKAVPFGFDQVSSNGAPNILSQLLVDVTSPNANQVNFQFFNDVGIASSIAEIYFEDSLDVLEDIASITDSDIGPAQDVVFEENTPPPPRTLPDATFTEHFRILAEPPPSHKGIDDDDEWVSILFNLTSSLSLNDIITIMSAGNLRIGMHVIAFDNRASESYINQLNPIPLPAGLVLFLSGLAGIGVLGRYKSKRREVPTA